MAQSEPNPNNNPTVTGQEAWFNEDARFYKDVYVYGNLYYDFEGTDALNLDNLNVSGIATFSDVDITGSLDVTDLTLRNLFSTGISTFTEAVFLNQVDDFQVGILTVTDTFRVSSSSTEFVTISATGSRAGNVGIGSTLPDQKLDVGGSVHIDAEIFDSDNVSGNIGNYLSKDAGGIRWVDLPPNATADGIFARNEGINIGVGSFTTINLIGNRSGGDVVFGSDAGGGVLDIDIRSRCVQNAARIHTTKNVGIGGTALEDFQLKIHGSLDTNIAGVGVATIGIATFGGTYKTVRPNDKILSPTNNAVALTEIDGNNIIAIDVAQETVAIGTIGRAPQYNFSNVSLENKRMSTVSVIGLGSGPGNVSAGNDYTINGGSVKQLTWATASTPNFDSSHYNIITFRILQDSVGLTSVFAVKE